MICSFCQHPVSRVVDSRVVGDAIRRRRECARCSRRFSTMERIERRMPQAIKKDGRRQAFDRDKVRSGFELACRKRPVSTEWIEAAVARVEARAFQDATEGEVSTRRVGELVLDELRQVDRVAFLRFASVYQEFNTPEQFLELLGPLLDGDRNAS